MLFRLGCPRLMGDGTGGGRREEGAEIGGGRSKSRKWGCGIGAGDTK